MRKMEGEEERTSPSRKRGGEGGGGGGEPSLSLSLPFLPSHTSDILCPFPFLPFPFVTSHFLGSGSMPPPTQDSSTTS